VAIFIDAHDPRGAKAIRLATQAITAGWPHQRAYWMPSSSNPTRVYLATRVSCECADFRFRGHLRPCHHSLAVELLCAAADEVAAF
jgi:hypothetical protein